MLFRSDGGAGLNVTSVETFEKLQVPYERLAPTRPFTGVTDGTTVPLGQVRLAVTFGTRHNYRTETLDFDVAHISLPYNAILGYPALAKFMASCTTRTTWSSSPGVMASSPSGAKWKMRCAPSSMPSRSWRCHTPPTKTTMGKIGRAHV